MENRPRLSTLLDYLEVFQICDSTFPIGTFNHSFGMENYLHDRKISTHPNFNNGLKIISNRNLNTAKVY